MRVLVCTVVHHPTDARIFRREIGALIAAGHDVTSIAPWPAGTHSDPHHERVGIPRAIGRRRFAAWRAARARISALAISHDVLLIHDPELLCVIPWWELRRTRTRVIWDVHEDLAAALRTKRYLPRLARMLLPAAIVRLERWAEGRAELLLAERAYQERFRHAHEVVLNLPYVPARLPETERKRRVIYVGSITRARGLDEMLALAPLLAPAGIGVQLIGEAWSEADRERIRSTANVAWEGPLPNAEALAEVEHSMVGLALLHDLPNFRHSMPTKILEYMAAGTAVVATPLPLSREVLQGCGVVLPDFPTRDLQAVAAEIIALCDDTERRRTMVEAAFARVAQHYNWDVRQADFVRAVTRGD